MSTATRPAPTVAIVNPIADPAWEALLAGARSVEVFHHPRWLELLRSSYGYEVSACCLRAPGGELLAGLPIARVESRLTGRRLVSLPFSDTCGAVLAAAADADDGAALGRAVGTLAASAGLGLTVRAPLAGAPAETVRRRFVRHRLDLAEDPAAVAGGFAKARTRNVRKARREGLAWERGTDRAALDDFYRLHLATRRRLGIPTQPRRFIRGLEELFAAGLGFVATVRDGALPVAAGVFLVFDRTLTYKYGASDPAALARRPNDLLHAETIRWGCEQGLAVYDLGRTDLDNAGLRSFKRGWGAEESDLAYTHLGAPVPAPGQGRGERLGAVVIRRSPKLVGRLAGAALYRHVG